jgi:FkbM family methyltransferase
MHNGLKVLEGGYYGAWMTEVIRLLEGHHEPQEERAFHEILRHLRPGANMVELGCFWCYYSLWFAQQVPGGRIVLVEPDPGNLAVGRQNIALNGVAGEFIQASVGRANAPPTPFFCESDNAHRDVPQVGVDDLMRDTGLPRVDLLLADIQGAELEMLRGAAASIARGGVRFVFLSTHHHAISGDPLTHQKCVEFVRKHGGHILVEHNVTESFSGDGLIAASFDPADRGLPPIHVSRNWPSNSLFRELEYDLAEAWTAIDAVGASVRGLRDAHPLLGKRW